MEKKPHNNRPHEYEKKLVVNATFEELVAISLNKEIKDNSASVKERKSKGSRK